MNRVAVTGLGAVSCLGHDVAALWSGVVAGQVGIGPIVNMSTDRLSLKIAGEVRGFDPEDHFSSRRILMLDRSSQLALVAAREAFTDAGLSVEGFAADLPKARRAGAVVGAAIGQATLDAAYYELYAQNAARLHPFTIPRVMPNAIAGNISIEFGLKGPAYAVSSACASSNHAIGQAFHMIRSGMLDVAVTGGADATVVLGVMKSWEGLRVISPEACRPFSADRSGFIIGEGAGILILENLEHAVARGARIHAEVVGFGMSADGADMTAPDAAGAAWAISEALRDGGIDPTEVDYVNAHGTGTRLNDKTEVAALRTVFGAHLDHLPVSSTKSMIGHCQVAAGALEMVVASLALRESVLPPTMGFRSVDPECAIDCVANVARRVPLNVAISNSFAFGGLNAVLVAKRYH